MSVPSVQVYGLEQAPPVRLAGTAGTAQSRTADGPRAPELPQDQVTVSEQARKLSAGNGGAQGSGANGEVELKLDFRKLRELVSSRPSKNQSQSA